MKIKHAGWAVAVAAAALSVPAFAQTNVQSASGVTVTSGTGVTVTPGVPAIVPGTQVIPGAVMAQSDVQTSVSGNTKTTVTRYWVNVPSHAAQDPSFQRWQGLR